MTDAVDSLASLHSVLIELAIHFDKYCVEHGISYYLMGGTALGAMRHKGFIPWDDDFDVFMDSENYFRFLELAAISPPSHCYVQTENSEDWPLFFSKLRLNGTTYIERGYENEPGHKGIYIDVMCLNACSQNTPIRFTQYFAARCLSAWGLTQRNYSTNSAFKRIALAVARVTLRSPVRRLLLNYVRRWNQSDPDSRLVAHFFGRANFRAAAFPRAWLGCPRYTEFGNVMLPVPQCVEEYLASRFGRTYMNLPSDQTRAMYPSHAAVVDLGTGAELLRSL